MIKGTQSCSAACFQIANIHPNWLIEDRLDSRRSSNRYILLIETAQTRRF